MKKRENTPQSSNKPKRVKGQKTRDKSELKRAGKPLERSVTPEKSPVLFCTLQFGPDIYHNMTEECECSPFRLLEMLYVYLMLPEHRGLSVCLCEDTQRLCRSVI